jgi:hypothetical protein
VVSQETVANSAFRFANPYKLIVNPKNPSEFVVADDIYGLTAVNIESGVRRVVSSDKPSRGPTPDGEVPFDGANDVLFWEKNNVFLVPNRTAIIRVDSSVGSRTILSDNQDQYGAPLVQAKHIALDAQRQRFIINDQNYSAGDVARNSVLLTMDPETGVRAILSDSLTPNSFNALQFGSGFYYDGSSDYALVADGRRDAVVAVDVINGQRVIISKSAN